MATKLTQKQARFVEHYQIHGNATQAAIAAGYSEKSAHVMGCNLLKNSKISKQVAAAQAKFVEESGVTRDWLEEQYRTLAIACKDTDPAVSRGCFDSLARMGGHFNDKLNMSGAVTIKRDLTGVKRTVKRKPK